MNFKLWLENETETETEKVDSLNMTAKLHPNLGFSPDLTRGFHLNTIVGRMLQPWIGKIERFKISNHVVVKKMKYPDSDKYPDVDQKITDKIFGIYKKYINQDGTLNKNFYLAYDFFKNELSNAINSLPFKTAKDITKNNKYVDVLYPLKNYFYSYSKEEDSDLFKSLDNALKINLMVFSNEDFDVQNFIDFLKIVRDEFMTIGEKLSSFHEPAMELANKEMINAINKKIKEFESKKPSL